MASVNFKYDLHSLVRTALTIRLEKNGKDDDSYLNHKYEFVDSLKKDEINIMLEKWSELNNGELTVFAKDEDADQLLDIMVGLPRYKCSKLKYGENGELGLGIYDKELKIFIACDLGDHYNKIIHLFEMHLPDLYDKYMDFIEGKTKDTKDIDDYVMKNIKLVGNTYNGNYYKPSTYMGGM